MRPATGAPRVASDATPPDDAAIEARYLVHYIASNASATYTGAQPVWALSEMEAERKARAMLEPYCVNPLTGDLRLAIGAIVRQG